MYFDLITKIRNAQAAKKETLKVPFSKADFAVAELLNKNSYVGTVVKKGKGVKKVMEISLRYDHNNAPVINGVKFFSTPSRRLYVGYRDLKPVKQGYGLAVVSTPAGVLTNNEARKMKVGGELLFNIW